VPHDQTVRRIQPVIRRTELVDAWQKQAHHALPVVGELVVAYLKVPEMVGVLVVAVEESDTAIVVLDEGILECDIDTTDRTCVRNEETIKTTRHCRNLKISNIIRPL